MSSSMFMALLIIFFEIPSFEAKDFFYINLSKNWNDAQAYCRAVYTDLAIVTNSQENQQMVAPLTSTTVFGWIGIKRKGGENIFRWSNGTQASYFSWYTGQPNGGLSQDACANAGKLGWNDHDCSGTATFFCHSSLTLVEKNMTWDEASTYCRINNTDLASLPFQTQLGWAGTLVQKSQNQAGRVWTGLRFQDGQWLWVNKALVQNVGPLSTCPDLPNHCVAYNFNTSEWEVRDCNEKLTFLCN